MSPERDSALHAAVILFGTQRGHAMLGCDWGTVISYDDDRKVCTRQARQRMVLHEADGLHIIQVCYDHARVVLQHTDPHAG